MKMRALWVTTSSVFLIAAVNSTAQRASLFQVPEQASFSAEDEQVRRPVSLPPTIKAILANDRGVQSVLEHDRLTAQNLPEEWFLVSEVHLNGPGERDLVVIATGPLAGANVTTFWIFHPTYDRYLPILNGAPAHDLRIMDTRSNGYRDIELVSATAVQVFTTLLKFDGKTYQKGK